MLSLVPGFTPEFLQIVRASAGRKAESDLRLKFYHDQQSEETARLIAQRYASSQAFRLFQVNIVRKIINKRATAYRIAPKRTFEGMPQEVGEALYQSMAADLVLKRAARLTKLLKTAAIQVGWAGSRPTLALVTPNIMDVVHTDPENPERVIVTHRGLKDSDTTYSDWTATSFTKRDWRGVPILVPGNRQNINPYGRLPFVPLFDSFPDADFFLPGGSDVIEAQQAVNVALVNLWRAVELQAHGQAWASGVPAGDAIRVGPDRAVTLPENGKFGFAAPNAPIEEILRAIEFVMRQTAAANDLSADVFDLETKSESGAAKHAERMDLIEARQDDIELWRLYEARLFDVLKTVVNTHSPGTIPENASIRVDFAEMRESISDTERLDNAGKRLEIGLWSPVDAFMAENPDFGTREEVLEELRRRKAEADELSTII